MPLIALWQSNADAVGEFRVEQVVAAAGDGILKDGTVCSKELNIYFSQITSEKLSLYAEQCLSSKFDKSGFILQDLVNELGRRLDYKVRNGRYQGIPNAVGYDGIWLAPEGSCIVIEVKTTDAYRISLDNLFEYRKRLISAGDVVGQPSILIVVGRQDTGELEAQVRGSRHAWDIRLISVEALCKLVKLKETSDDSETGRKIREILMPLEYTRLDRLVDVMFTAASEVAPEIVSGESIPPDDGSLVENGPISKSPNEISSGSWQLTDGIVLQAKRNEIIRAMSKKISAPLIKKSRALYWDSTHKKRVACTMSKLYTKRSSTPYWYAFHPQWDKFLEDSEEGFLVLGCMDLFVAFSLPHIVIRSVLPGLNTTASERGTYWHIHLTMNENGTFELIVPKTNKNLPLSEYIILLDEKRASM